MFSFEQDYCASLPEMFKSLPDTLPPVRIHSYGLSVQNIDTFACISNINTNTVNILPTLGIYSCWSGAQEFI